MAGPVVGLLATLAWGGTEHASLATVGVEGREFTFTPDAESFETTRFAAATGARTHTSGLQSGVLSWDALLKVPKAGHFGLVTYSAGTVINVTGFTLNIDRDEFDSTVFASTAPTFKSYLPGGWGWGGSFDGYLDNAVAMKLPGNSSEPATGTFRYIDTGTTDATLAGSMFTTQASAKAGPKGLNTLSYTFQGSGDLTSVAPTGGVPIFPAGAISGEAAQTITATAHTGITFGGTAFWKSVNITCQMGGLVTIGVSARFTGTITLAP